MTTTRDAAVTGIPNEPQRPPGGAWLPQLLRRLHFYAGIFVGPFILVAALSGAAYAAAPTVDHLVYHHQVTTDSRGPALPLSAQVASAQRYIAGHHPGDVLLGVKPAAHTGATTQVMFSEHGLLDGQVRSVWIDPVTAAPHGDLKVFSTALPISTWIDFFHRTLFLGDVGRAYSELAASWLGVIALAGLGLWIARLRRTRTKRELLAPTRRGSAYRRLHSWHTATGVWLLLGALFLSATGITWSLHAGANVSEIRSALDWSTPSLTTTTTTTRSSTTTTDFDGSAQRHGDDLDVFDEVLAKARATNIHNSQIEIDLPSSAGQAWTVREIRREWPVAANSVAIDPSTMAVVSHSDWASFPLAAKLTSWGVNAHMGLLFGLANQIVLFALGLGFAAMVVLGYLMWWRRRPMRGARRMGRPPSAGGLAKAPLWAQLVLAAAAIGVGVLLSELGITLLAFLLIDALIMATRPAIPVG
ncbi:PepSY-associated TM helix domain-containing protein [Rudaeicoccus suwonensis]|uniref:Putative iron-regulated membrane protein n=1 Tax=Rudaeicoccus suwonensis TaxID=657409 RepID=A0A561E1B2_9MICO|nr:PepSY domain-containing protein [Rudaeicoccus suwonensis]TWE09418.1 putative iron-regulated membrane protein [Rudaeicoccus suwonensis]